MYYFDNAATTFPKPEQVYSFMDSYYRLNGVNVGRGQFSAAVKASALVTETRKLLLQLFHCKHDKEVVFTSSATEAINIILQGLKFSDNQVVYITPFEHNAVLRTLNYLKNIFKLKIFMLDVDKQTLTFDLKKIKYAFQKNRPSYVFMTHASNAFGNIVPVQEICELAKQQGAVTMVDMAQTAGLIDIDLSETMADYAVFAGHKTLYGPFGIAGFITSKSCSLEPLLYGGTGIDSQSEVMPISTPERFEAGSPNIVAIAGLNASLQWINELGIDNIRAKEKTITSKLLEVLSHYQNITTIRSKNEDIHIGVVSCVFDGYSSDNIGNILNNYGIAVRTGLHCAPQAHNFMGTSPEGTVRFSVSFFTTDNDISELEKALDFIQMNG